MSFPCAGALNIDAKLSRPLFQFLSLKSRLVPWAVYRLRCEVSGPEFRVRTSLPRAALPTASGGGMTRHPSLGAAQ